MNFYENLNNLFYRSGFFDIIESEDEDWRFANEETENTVVSHLQADDVPDRMEITLRLWEDLKSGIYDIVLSEAAIIELSRCYEPKRSILQQY